MKKLLALVLALVMTLSLCTVSNAAYKDAADVDYKEAVEVMSAIGVLQGDENGKFNPDGTLTREQAAKIICYMLLGAKTANKLSVDKAPFADVAADRWSAPFIAYCAASGIVDGLGDGTFNPAGKLTGHAFGKMLLTALGIKGEFTGASWAINVATALVKNDLDEDIENIGLSKELARQEAAQLAFNAVKFNGTEKVYGVDTDGDGKADMTFDDRTDAILYASSNGIFNYLGKVENIENSLLADVFEVTVATGADKFGHVANVYSNNDWDDDLTIAEAAKYTFTASKSYDNTTAANLSDAINKELGITADAKKLVVVNGDTVKYNNDPETIPANRDFVKGDKVEIYMNGTSKTDVATVIVTRYELVKVTAISDLSAATIKANSTNADKDIVNAKKSVTMMTWGGTAWDAAYTLAKNYDTQIPGFAYEKNDFVLVAKRASTNAVLDTKAAETVSGTINTTKGAKVGIDGTYYAVAASATTAINTKGTWALNASGALAADVDVTEYTEDFIYIYSINKKTTTDDGLSGTSYVAYGVNNKGEKVSYTLATVAGTTNATKTYIKGGKDVAKYALDDTTAPLPGGLTNFEIVTAYKLNKDGNLEVADSKLTVGAKVSATYDVSKTAAQVASNKFATADTAFVFTYTDAGALKTKVTTGYTNVKITAATTPYVAVTNLDKAVYVFVVKSVTTPAAVDASESVVYAVKDGGYVYDKNADTNKETFTYTFLTADGEKVVAASASNGTVNGYAQGKVFAYTVNSNATISVQAYCTDTNVTFVNGAQIQTADGKTIDTSAVKLYTVTLHTDSETVDVTDGATFQKDDPTADGYNLTYCVDSSAKVVAIFVLNTIAD